MGEAWVGWGAKVGDVIRAVVGGLHTLMFQQETKDTLLGAGRKV